MDLTGILLISGCVIMLLACAAVVFGPMFGWRIAAKHEEFIQFASEPAPREKIKEAFRELGWTLYGEAPDGLVARTGINWRSWGEVVSLEFRCGGADVRSECAFSSQIVDYGRNRMNVQTLIEALKRRNA